MARSTTTITTTALLIGLLGAKTAHAQTATEGAFELTTQEGAALGTARIDGASGDLVLDVRLRDGTARPSATRDRSKQGLVFVASGTGLAGGITNTAGSTMTIELVADGAGFRATRKRAGQVVGREKLTRIRTALIVHAVTYDQSHVNAFQGYATQIARWYRSNGYSKAETLPGISHDAVIDKLLAAERDGKPYERLVYIGHGGWDGPILGTYSTEGTHQTSSSEEPETFARLIDAIKRGTTPAAKIFSSSCHAGGSNVYERASKLNSYVWTDDVARRTGRVAAGPAGYTSTEYTQQHVLSVLEGQGVTRQEVRWASREGVRTIRGGGTLAGVAISPFPATAPPASTTVTASAPPASTTVPASVPVGGGPTFDAPLGD